MPIGSVLGPKLLNIFLSDLLAVWTKSQSALQEQINTDDLLKP